MAKSSKLESRQQKTKEKLEKKAREKKEEEERPEEQVEEEEKEKIEVKKPEVSKAKAKGDFMQVKIKDMVEVSRFIRGLPVEKAKRYLNEVIEKDRSVPYKKYNTHLAHKKGGVGSGRYPVKAAKKTLKIVESAEANAEYLELDSSNLFVKEAIPNKVTSNESRGNYSSLKITVAEGKE